MQFSKPEYIRLDPNALSFTKGSNIVRIDYPNFKTDFPLESYDSNVLVQIKNAEVPQGTFSNFNFDSINETVTITIDGIENSNLKINVTGDDSCIRIGQYINLELDEQTEDTYEIRLEKDDESGPPKISPKNVGDIIYKDFIVTKATSISGSSFNVKLSNSSVLSEEIDYQYTANLSGLSLEKIKKDEEIVSENGDIFKSLDYYETGVSSLDLRADQELSLTADDNIYLRKNDYTLTKIEEISTFEDRTNNVISHVHLTSALTSTVAEVLVAGKSFKHGSSYYIMNSDTETGDTSLTVRGDNGIGTSESIGTFDQFSTTLSVTSVEARKIDRMIKNTKINKNKRYPVIAVNVSTDGVQTITLNVGTNLSIQSSNPRTGKWKMSEFGKYITKKEISKPHVISYVSGVDIDGDTGNDYFNINLPLGITSDTTFKTGGNSMDIILMKGTILNENAITITKGSNEIKISHADHPFFENEDLYISGVEIMEMFNFNYIESGLSTITGNITEYESIVTKEREYTKLRLKLQESSNITTDIPSTGNFIYLENLDIIFKDGSILNKSSPYQIDTSERYPMRMTVNLNNSIQEFRDPSYYSTESKWNSLRNFTSVHNKSGVIESIEVLEGPSRKINISLGVTGLLNITGITDISSILKINDSVIIEDADIEFDNDTYLLNGSSYKIIDIRPRDLLNKPPHLLPSNSRYNIVVDLKQNIKNIHSSKLKLIFSGIGLNKYDVNNQHKIRYIDKNSYILQLNSNKNPRFNLNYLGGNNIVVGTLLFNGIPINNINADYPIIKKEEKVFIELQKLIMIHIQLMRIFQHYLLLVIIT